MGSKDICEINGASLWKVETNNPKCRKKPIVLNLLGSIRCVNILKYICLHLDVAFDQSIILSFMTLRLVIFHLRIDYL